MSKSKKRKFKKSAKQQRRPLRKKAKTKRTVVKAKKNVVAAPVPSPRPPGIVTSTAPHDALWLEILKRDEQLKLMPESQVRAELFAGGFPVNLINDYIARRSTYHPDAPPPERPPPPDGAPPPGDVAAQTPFKVDPPAPTGPGLPGDTPVNEY